MNTLINEIYESIKTNEKNFYIEVIYKSSLINFTENLEYYLPMLWQNSKDVEPNYLNFISGINKNLEKFYPNNNNQKESIVITENLDIINTFLNKEIFTLGMEVTKNNIRNSLMIDSDNTSLPEYDFSDNEDKEKVIILEKLGVIDYIKSIQTKPEVISHTAEILSSFTGIKSSTLYTYLRPMLNLVRDNTDKNSPYKNEENLMNANIKIHKLKIKNR